MTTVCFDAIQKSSTKTSLTGTEGVTKDLYRVYTDSKPSSPD